MLPPVVVEHHAPAPAPTVELPVRDVFTILEEHAKARPVELPKEAAWPYPERIVRPERAN